MSKFDKALEIIADLKRINARTSVHLERATSALDSALQILDQMPASVDTRPQGGDPAETGAPFTSGAAAKPRRPNAVPTQPGVK